MTPIEIFRDLTMTTLATRGLPPEDWRELASDREIEENFKLGRESFVSLALERIRAQERKCAAPT